MNDTVSIPITQLRQRAADVISDVTNKGISVVIMQRSRPRAVIADYDYFNSLEEASLDLLDAKEAEKAKKESKIPLSVYIKKRWGG